MKHKAIKRILSLMLTAVMVLGIFAGAMPASAANAAYVYSFNQLKDSLEDPDITDVYVYAQDNDIPWRGITSGEYEYAITVAGTKNLHLQARAVFRVTKTPTDDYVKYSSLIHVPSDASLTVDGEGTLDFDAYWANCVNAVIHNEGVLVIRNADLAGVCMETKASACAIWHKSGSLVIHDGDFYGLNKDTGIDHWGAVRLLAPATICGGYFRSAVGQTGAYGTGAYGLMIPGNTSGITITGGTFRGIYLPTETTPFANYVPSKYTTLKDGSWFNPQSEYSQDYVRSAVVKVVNWIKEISISIKAPMEGMPLDYNPVIHTDGYYLTVPVWLRDGNALDETKGPSAVAGASYKLRVWVIAADTDSYEFASGSNLKAYINGHTATISDTGIFDREDAVSLELDFGTCKKLAGEVYLSVTAPQELEKVRFVASVTNTELCTVLSNVKWYENGKEIFSGATFKEGANYSVAMEIKAKTGSEFPLDEQGNPNVYCRVNGYDAEVYAVDGKDPSQYAQVRFDFGQCNDSIIEHISVTGITPPVPGEHPSYSAAVLGNGYRVDTAKESYYDAYWVGEKWYYVKNGVSWWDVTDGGFEYVYDKDVFLPGHEYRCEIHVTTEDGYEFVKDLYTDPETWPTVTVNGKPGGLTFDSASGLNWKQEVEYTFPVEPVDIKGVLVTGLDTPVAGATPDYSAEVGNPYLYEMDPGSGHEASGIWWFNENDIEMIPGYHTFQAGQTYHLLLCVAAKALDSGEPVGKFVDNLSVLLDGYTVDRVHVWDEIIMVNAYYTCPAAIVQGGAVTGSINASDSSEPAFIRIYEDGEEEPLFEEYARDDYSFTGLANGHYVMTVSKKNHVARTYDITVADGKVEQDIKLHLIGDIDGNGKINVGDVAKVSGHIKGSSKLTDDYQLQCANINGGSLNMGDTAALYAHIKGTKKLY